MAASAHNPVRTLARAGTIVLCLALALAVAGETASSVLTRRDPASAVLWPLAQAEPLEALAESRTSEALTPSEIDTAVATAQRAVKAAPIAAVPLRVLAEAKYLSGDTAATSRLMAIAGSRNLRDSRVQLWLLQESFESGRYDEAFMRADMLLRRHGDLAPSIYPRMVAVLDKPQARAAFLATMRKGPNWRSDFFRAQAGGEDEEGLSLWLLDNLARSPNPPTDQEAGLVTAALARQHRWPQVRQVWEAFGGGKLAAPYNGSFELTAREPPFGWRLSNNDGAIGAIDRLDGGANHGLYAEFPSGRAATLAEQLMVLAPGHYRFSGRVKADRLPAGALYRWIATCFDADQPLVQVQTDTVKGWQSFAAEFDVPAQGCDAQWLRLGGTGGEGYEPASAWYDDLKLERLS